MIRRIVHTHCAIVIVLTLFILLAFIYSTTTPLFEAPDEQWHFAFVQHVATGRGLPVQTEPPLTHLARQEGSQPPLYYLLAAAATFWIDTSDFPGIVWENPHYGYNVPGIVNDNKNLFIHTSLESFPYHGVVLAIRLARWLSVMMGALAVLFTYWLALEIFDRIVIASEAKQSPIRELEIASGKDRPRNDNWNKVLAASAAAIVAFTPQFLFISGAVSNDSTIVAMSALSLWLMFRLLTADRRLLIAFALGIACGLAALAKVSGLGLAALTMLVFGGQIFLRSAVGGRKSEIRNLTFEILLFAFAFLLVAGWWYARNLVLYGELTGTARMRELFYVRATPMPLDQLLVQLREVWETFWIGFGWGNIRAHPVVYTVIEIFAALAVLGWILKIRNSQFTIRNARYVILFVWLALMFAALVYWMQTTQAPHGRLFFPALPAFAVLIVGGLAQFQRSAVSGQRSRFTFHGLVLPFAFLLFAFATLAPFLILQPAYAYPLTLDAHTIAQVPNRVDISYDDKIQLLGYDVSTRRVSPGEALELTLYWQGLTVMDEDYSIGISVVDAQQRVIGARNSYHGRGMLPTRLWFAGQAIRDTYWLPIDVNASAGIAQIQVSLYERVSRRTLIARDPRGEIITPFIGQIEIVLK
jgi:4-amino-4-deoxy-L-arabinose transferase-like glycosyltransferase